MQRRIRWAALLAIASSVLVLVHAAQAKDWPAKWKLDLGVVDQQLRAGQFTAAERGAEELRKQMTEHISRGEGAPTFLGMALAFRALAASGLGHADDALWDWQVATQLFPEVENLDMALYPAAVRLSRDSSPTPGEARRLADTAILKPRILRRVQPIFPAVQRGRGRRVTVVVETILGADGIPRHPHIMSEKTDPTLVCETLEAMRQWRFAPATLDGKPVQVYFLLTTEFTAR